MSSIRLPAGDRDELRPRWSIGRVRLLVAAVHAAIAAPLIIQAVYHPDRFTGPDDFTTHLRVALPETWRKPWVPGPPHFVWHTLVKVFSWLLPGTGYLLGAVVVSVLFAALTGIVWFEVLRRPGFDGARLRRRWAAAGSVVLVCMESPTTLRGWGAIVGPDYWLPLHAYHGPTGPAARPLVALLVVGFVTAASGRSPDRLGRWAARWMAPLSVAAALTKPTLSVLLIPTVFIVGLTWSRRDGRRPWEVVGPLVRRFVAPTIGIVGLQYVVMAFQVPPKYRQETLIRPFEVILAYHLYRPLFWTVLALPVAMLATFGWRLLQDRCVEVSLWAFAGGLGLLVLQSSTNLDRDGLAALWFLVHPTALFLLFGTRRGLEILRTEPGTVARAGLVACALLAALSCFAWAEFTSCELQQACFT